MRLSRESLSLIPFVFVMSTMILALPAETESMPGGRAEGRFGKALVPVTQDLHRASLPGLQAYNETPLTVECWVKLRSALRFNILVANHPKSSPLHWEIFSQKGTGYFSAYLPGNSPDTITSSKKITDNTWRHVGFSNDGKTIVLYVDGEEVARAPYTRKAVRAPSALLFIGDVDSIGCQGLIDEVRISSCIRDLSALPTAPFSADAATLALLHLDGDGSTEATVNDALPPGYVWGRDGLVCQQRIWSKTVWGKELRVSGVREAVVEDWKMQFDLLRDQLYGLGLQKIGPHVPDQVYDKQALIAPEDRDPVDVVLRRSASLLTLLQASLSPSAYANFQEALSGLRERVKHTPPVPREGSGHADRQQLYLDLCAFRRDLSFANPLLDFDDILCVVRGVIHGPDELNRDHFGQHQTTQFFAINSVPGGGLFRLKNFKSGTPEFINILENSVVQNGRHQGEKLNYGAFMTPDLSFDGEKILFSWTENTEHREHVAASWTEDTVWHIFSVNQDGSELRQLTDGPYNDFDATWLPSGRIAFISERRGGFIRCFNPMYVPNYVLHSMKADGSDLYPLSYFETSEWSPSVNNDGMLVYSRWDYVDRNDCLGSNFWICYPDGTDPRAPHGNYPRPWHTFGRTKEESLAVSTRHASPFTEMGMRQIPDSHRYVLSAVPHHGEAFGSLCILDLHKRDDGEMSQLKRLTPYAKFPEVETPGRRYDVQQYGAPWPLSEDFFLCVWYENMYLLDRFGNQECLAAPHEAPCEGYQFFRAMDPIPFRARTQPPAIAPRSNQGEDAQPDVMAARISVMNVYDSDIPLPESTKIKWLRVVQNIVKDNHPMDIPRIGYGQENTPRIPLGIVPVEEDGSAYFWAPIEKELIFQVLDENYMAVQSMKSVAFVHPGEHLSCVGCHEDVHKTPLRTGLRQAMNRPPSSLRAETEAVEPVNFHRLVRPIFEGKCLPCHQKEGRGLQDMSYAALEPYAFHWAGGFLGSWCDPEHNGARTIPGKFGARHSKIGRKILEPMHRSHLSEEEYRRIVLWLDCNSLELGAFHDVEAQQRGELVWPTLDVDPADPQGLEHKAPEQMAAAE